VCSCHAASTSNPLGKGGPGSACLTNVTPTRASQTSPAYSAAEMCRFRQHRRNDQDSFSSQCEHGPLFRVGKRNTATAHRAPSCCCRGELHIFSVSTQRERKNCSSFTDTLKFLPLHDKRRSSQLRKCRCKRSAHVMSMHGGEEPKRTGPVGHPQGTLLVSPSRLLVRMFH